MEDGELNDRRPKTRKKGGFLLQNMFHSSSTKSKASSSRSSLDPKGKGKQENGRADLAKNLRTLSPSGSKGTAKGSPLSKVAISRVDGQEEDGSQDDESPRHSHDDFNRDNRHPSDTEVEASSRPPQVSQTGPAAAPAPAIDPTQIVNMALNLSANRQRNISGGPLLGPPGTNNRRDTSAGMSGAIPTLQGGYQTTAGGSLRQYLQQQRRISRTLSPGHGRRSVSAKMASSSSPFGMGSYLDATSTMPNIQFPVSAATLARAEKARSYIEGCVEFRRLLQFLPPLKPDASSPGNFTYSAMSVPGSPTVELSKVPSRVPERFELGRRYDPLQLIRNRKLRARTRNPLNPSAEDFDDPDEVREWVDAVEALSKAPGYRGMDKVALAPYPLHGELPIQKPAPLGHSRSESVAKPKRLRMDWYTSPQEMLADAYWLEQGDNKRQLENHYGNNIFPPKSSIESLRPRPSHERQRSRSGSFRRSIGSFGSKDDSDGSRDSYRGRKRHSLLHQHHEGTGKLKHAWDKARGRSPSPSSDLSVSDHGESVTSKTRRLPRLSQDEENVGPLERHMDQMLAADTVEIPLSSPSIVSPGTPDKWGRNLPVDPEQVRKAELKADGVISKHTDVTDFVDNPPPSSALHHKSTPSLMIERPGEPRSSLEDYDSTNPNSPTAANFVSNLSRDISPSSSRIHSPTRKSRKAILPFIRSEGNPDSRKLDANGPFVDDTDQSSRHTSGETRPRSSLEVVSSPNKVKQLFSHKTNDSLSSILDRPSSRGKDSRAAKEPESGVRRFFKGGRFGEIVRNEGAKVGDLIRKKDSHQEAFADDTDESTDFLDESDTDETNNNNNTNGKVVKARPQPTRRTTGTSGSRRESPEKPQRYHTEGLPYFKHSVDRHDSPRPGTPDADHISNQQHVVRHSRSARFDRLAPPELDLSHISSRTSTASPTLSRGATLTPESAKTRDQDKDSRRGSYGFARLLPARSNSRVGRRLQAMLDVPGGVGSERAGIPSTMLSNVRANRNQARPSLMDKRHWSISDKHQSQSRSRPPISRHSSSSSKPSGSSTIVPKSEISRIRALLLCSGIKAAELARRAHNPPRTGPSHFLVAAATTAGVCVRPDINKDQEHIVAAKLLTGSLESDTRALRSLISHLHSGPVASLHAAIEDLRTTVESSLERSRASADDAGAFGGQVSGQGTMECRRVMDSLAQLARKRRRRLRWVRRLGFGLLEWGVLLLMWWVWFLVVVGKGILNVGRAVGGAVKWLLWLK
jgi:hypothetical protein